MPTMSRPLLFLDPDSDLSLQDQERRRLLLGECLSMRQRRVAGGGEVGGKENDAACHGEELLSGGIHCLMCDDRLYGEFYVRLTVRVWEPDLLTGRIGADRPQWFAGLRHARRRRILLREALGRIVHRS